MRLNYSPNNKIVNKTKLEAFADNKSNVVEMIISVFDSVKKRRKGENACYQHFLIFPPCLLPIPKYISVFNPLPDDKFYTLPN